MKFERLGWIVAAALLGAMVATGFQGNSTKIATVDIKKVFDQSDFAAKQTEVLQNLGTSRQSVLEFINQYRVMKIEDAKKFRDLSTKANPSAADKDALDKLKAQVQADDAAYRALQQKNPPTDADKQQLQAYSTRSQALGALEAQWAQEFNEEVNKQQSLLRDQALAKVKDSINKVASTQGYSIVFVSDIAPYSANDITDESLKTMNKK